jgi:hypothetical protein
MHLAGLNPFGTHKKIKIFAERNTGSIYLEWLLNNNLKVDLVDFYTLGWKHRLAPSELEVSEQMSKELIFICLVKNPYSWLQSMHLRPYQHDELTQLSFSQFIRFSYGDYRNPIQLWNGKNQSYVGLSKYTEKQAIVKYEHLLKDAQEVLEDLAKRFDMNKRFSWFVDNDQYMTNHHGILERKFHKDHYLKEQWKNIFAKEDIAFINKELDKELMQNLNYQYL